MARMSSLVPIPYVTPRRDTSRADARMAELMRYRGDIDIQGMQRAGQNRANMIAGIGRTVAGGLGDLVRYREDAPKRELQQRQMAEETRRLDEGERFRALDQSLAGQDDAAREKAYGEAGFTEQAAAAKGRRRQDEVYTLEMDSKRLKQKTDNFVAAGDMLESFTGPSAGAMYEASVPTLRELVPHLADQIPDKYDPAWVASSKDWGKKETEKLARQRAITEAAKEKISAATSAQTLTEKWTEYVGNMLSVETDGQGWDDTRMTALRSGAPQSVVELFGEAYSPDAAKAAGARARSLSSKSTAAAATTGEERALVRFASRLGKTPAELTQAEENTFIKTNRELGDKPSGAGGEGGVTPSVKATAIQQREVALAALEQTMGTTMTPAKQKAIDRVWKSFYEKIQQDPPPPVNHTTNLNPHAAAQAAARANPAAAPSRAPAVGATVVVKGKSYVVGKVYPDGTWDPK